MVKEAYPDHFAFDKKHKYFDAKSDPENPRWDMVDVAFVEKFDDVVGLPEIRQVKALADMVLVNNSRLSVQPVKKAEYDRIVKMGQELGLIQRASKKIEVDARVDVSQLTVEELRVHVSSEFRELQDLLEPPSMPEDSPAAAVMRRVLPAGDR